MPIANKPAMESNLSAIEITAPAVVEGNWSPEYLGRYCSNIAKDTISFSPEWLAYSIPILPCNSVNSLTILVVKSAFER